MWFWNDDLEKNQGPENDWVDFVQSQFIPIVVLLKWKQNQIINSYMNGSIGWNTDPSELKTNIDFVSWQLPCLWKKIPSKVNSNVKVFQTITASYQLEDA